MIGVQGGDLFDAIVSRGKYTEADASWLVYSMASAIYVCRCYFFNLSFEKFPPIQV